MGEKLHNIKEKIKTWWQESDKKKKITLGVGVVVFLFIITFLIMKLTAVNYVVLYSNLSLKDMGEITSKLDDSGTPWKVSEKTNSILVPAEDKNKVKIELATYGLPKESYSFSDAFDESSWTMTDYDKRQRMKQALQSELANTIADIEGINSAKVLLDDKDETKFVLNNEDTKRTASVFIMKDRAVELNNEKVIAIKHLVSGATNILPEDVIIIDNDGRSLDGNVGEGPLNGDYFSVKSDIESKVNTSIKKFLSNIYGYQNVDVLSSVKINMDSEETKIVEFSPPLEDSDEGLIRSMEELREEASGGVGGAPGTPSNPGDDVMDGGNDNYNRASTIINNELNEINREIRKAPGQVESITVAVLINDKSLPGGELTEEKEEEIVNLIYAATGLDTKNVKVIAEEFTTDVEAEGSESSKLPVNINFNKIALAIVLLIAIILLFRFLKNTLDTEEEQKLIIDESLIEKSGDLSDDFSFEVEEPAMKRQINEFIDTNPEAVTQLLRSWLNE